MTGISIEIRWVCGHLLFKSKTSQNKRWISLYDLKLVKSQDPRERFSWIWHRFILDIA